MCTCMCADMCIDICVDIFTESSYNFIGTCSCVSKRMEMRTCGFCVFFSSDMCTGMSRLLHLLFVSLPFFTFTGMKLWPT